MPWSLPLWLVSRRVRVEMGVDPEQPELASTAFATPRQVPIAMLWSPPSTSGTAPSRTTLRRRAGEPLAQAADDLRHGFARGLVGKQRLAPGGGDAARDEVRVEAGEPQARGAVAAAGVGGAEAARCADDLHSAPARAAGASGGAPRKWSGAFMPG